MHLQEVDIVDQDKKMLDRGVTVQPIVFKEHDAPTFHVKHFSDREDLVIQVFPKKEIDVLGGRVAKSLVDTFGERGMSSITVEVITDKSVAENSAVFIKCLGKGTDFYKDYLTKTFLDHLTLNLAAKQV
jgi:hypothetical protein